MSRSASGRDLCGALVALALLTGAAAGQIEAIQMEVSPEEVGLGGAFRPGQWTPMLVTLTNRSSAVRQVRIQWIVSDSDGDEVAYERQVQALNPQRAEQFWLYAPLPVTWQSGTEFRLRLIDEQNDRVLESRAVLPAREPIPPTVRAVGVMGTDLLGLGPYTHLYTQNESCVLLRGLTPRMLPDRWYGLSMIESLIWTPAPAAGSGQGDPTAIPRGAAPALRQWVQRGGHLVIVLPAVHETWTGSELKDLLPPVRMVTLPEQQAPLWLGFPRGGQTITLPVRIVEPIAGGDANVSVLLRDQDQRPLVVAWRFGLGRVTLVGIDLTDPRLTRADLPNGDLFWKAVFGWRGPALHLADLEPQVRTNAIARPELRAWRRLDGFPSEMIAMKETAAPALFAAILVYGLYWLMAGPVGYAVLRQRQLLHHSWSAFMIAVAFFSVIAWGGAALLRPRVVSVKHFSVLDVDVGSGLAMTHSWLAGFVPRHGLVEVRLEQGTAALSGGGGDTLSSMGLHAGGEAMRYTHTQSYAADAADPSHVAAPMRATAKQFELDYLARLSLAGTDQMSRAWGVLRGKVTATDTAWPRGQLAHSLPGDLRDVLMIYCPGDGREPFVWRHGPWPAGTTITLDGSPPPKAVELFLDRLPGQDRYNGFVGDLIDQKPGDPAGPLGGAPLLGGTDRYVYAIEALTIFSSLPAPKFQNVQQIVESPIAFERTFGRRLDLTRLLPLRALMIMGHLPNSPLPAPLRIDDEPVASSGWTVVRWVCPLE